MMTPKTTVLCLSGGLDSTTLLYEMAAQRPNVLTHAVLFDYGQPHVQELTLAKYHCHRLGILFTTITLEPLGGLTEDSSWIVKNRNNTFIQHAVILACRIGAESVLMGFNKDDEANFPDCRSAFLQLVNMTLLTSEIPVEVCAPYIDKSKAWIGGLARELGVDVSMIWSCYKGGEKPCGVCPACLKLAIALK